MSAPHRILSLDGGGIRGLITAVWLERLEQHLGGPVADHIDLVAGTSTGGILACAVASRLPARRIRELYVQRGRDIFPPAPQRLWSRFLRTFSEGVSAPKYAPDGLEKALREVFGERTFAATDAGPRLLVTSYDTEGAQALVLKNRHPRWAGVKLWEAARASAAAPTYFPAHLLAADGRTMPCIDGGVVANNPTPAPSPSWCA